MTSRRYPELFKETLVDLSKWAREVTRTREEDVKNSDQVNLKLAQLPQAIIITVGDEVTALGAGTAKVTFRMPFSFTLTSVKASVTTAATGATLLAVDINATAASILSTVMTFTAGSKTTVGAVTPAVISTYSLAADAEMTIDIDAVGSTVAGAGLKVYLIGYKT